MSGQCSQTITETDINVDFVQYFRVYYVRTTFDRNSILHVKDSLLRDLGGYTCKGYLEGLGYRQKSFKLISGEFITLTCSGSIR